MMGEDSVAVAAGAGRLARRSWMALCLAGALLGDQRQGRRVEPADVDLQDAAIGLERAHQHLRPVGLQRAGERIGAVAGKPRIDGQHDAAEGIAGLVLDA